MGGHLFLTGGTGYVGRHLLRALGAGDYGKIVCLSRGNPPDAPRNVEFIKADLLESAAYAPALTECDTVLHMAAVTGKSRPAEYFRVNREGTKALIGECRRAGVKRIIYVSTIAAKFRNQNRYYYAQSKRQAEELVATSGLRYTIVRPTIVMGKQAAVLEGLSRLASAPVLPIFGNGRALVQPVSVHDLAVCLSEILRGGFEGRTLEIGGPQILSMEELLVKIRRARGRAAGPAIHLPAAFIAAAVGLVEGALLPVLPFTAGQIASFLNDGTAAPDPCVREWQTRMENIDQMLSSVKPA
jgi:NADH dehydrogenase